MKPFVRNIIIAVLLTAIVVTFHIVRRNSTMRGIEISISDGCKNNLLDDGEIENLILGHYPGLEQTDIKEVDTKGIVELLSGSQNRKVRKNTKNHRFFKKSVVFLGTL